MMEKIDTCQAAVRDGLNDGLNVLESFETLTKEVGPLEDKFNTFKEELKEKSQLFAFWIDYIDIVQMLLQFL